MGWAVILLPDERADASAKRVWRAVHSEGFTAMLFDGDNRPHVSLMVLETQDGTLDAAVRRFTERAKPVSALFASIGSFGQDVIYFSPEPAASFYEMNRALTGELGSLAAMADPHYLPGRYTPHMTAAFKIPEGDYTRAMQAVKRNFLPFRGTFESVAVVKFNPVKIVAIYKLGEKPADEPTKPEETVP